MSGLSQRTTVNNLKPSAIKYSCLSLCEAERRMGKKGPFVFLGGRKKGDSRSCSCSHKGKAGDPRAWSCFSQPVSGRSAARWVCGHWEQIPGVRKDKCGPKEPPVDGLKVIVLHQAHHAGGDFLRVSFLEPLTQTAAKSRVGLCVWPRGMGPIPWAVVRSCPCLLAFIPKHDCEPADNPQRPKKS